MNQTKQGRLVYADLLRAAALAAVIALHVCGNNWQGLEVRTADWQILNVIDSLTRWCVPAFVMLSLPQYFQKKSAPAGVRLFLLVFFIRVVYGFAQLARRNARRYMAIFS